MKPVKEYPKQCGAERSALAHTSLLRASLPSCTCNLHGERAAGVLRLKSSHHSQTNPNGLQAGPQKVMLNCHRRSGDLRSKRKEDAVNEMAKGK